jgi:hypothetical protein
LEIQDGHQGLIVDEKITILPIDHHGGHKVRTIVFILGKNIANRLKSEIQNGRQGGFFRLIFH